jgi:hypothetical protein
MAMHLGWVKRTVESEASSLGLMLSIPTHLFLIGSPGFIQVQRLTIYSKSSASLIWPHFLKQLQYLGRQ